VTTAWRAGPGGVILQLRVTPNAGADRIEGIEVRDDGQAVLRVRVRAVPDRGKANAAVLALLARALGVPKSSVALTAGGSARHKTVALTGDAGELMARLEALAG
jgi:uncharacterized protein YggU (UPF0235/DUF167 family)